MSSLSAFADNSNLAETYLQNQNNQGNPTAQKGLNFIDAAETVGVMVDAYQAQQAKDLFDSLELDVGSQQLISHALEAEGFAQLLQLGTVGLIAVDDGPHYKAIKEVARGSVSKDSFETLKALADLSDELNCKKGLGYGSKCRQPNAFDRMLAALGFNTKRVDDEIELAGELAEIDREIIAQEGEEQRKWKRELDDQAAKKQLGKSGDKVRNVLAKNPITLDFPSSRRLTRAGKRDADLESRIFGRLWVQDIPITKQVEPGFDPALAFYLTRHREIILFSEHSIDWLVRGEWQYNVGNSQENGIDKNLFFIRDGNLYQSAFETLNRVMPYNQGEHICNYSNNGIRKFADVTHRGNELDLLLNNGVNYTYKAASTFGGSTNQVLSRIENLLNLIDDSQGKTSSVIENSYTNEIFIKGNNTRLNTGVTVKMNFGIRHTPVFCVGNNGYPSCETVRVEHSLPSNYDMDNTDISVIQQIWYRYRNADKLNFSRIRTVNACSGEILKG